MKWPEMRLAEICEINIGKTPSRSNKKYWNAGENHWLSISDISRGSEILDTKEKITNYAVNECNCKLVAPNTVLLSFKLSIGKVGINKIPLYTNEAIAALPVKDENMLDYKFLFHQLKYIDLLKGVDRAAKGLTLNKEKLKEIRVSCPPLLEQKRIASLFDTADNIVRLREQAIARLDELTRSAFLEIQSKRIDFQTVKVDDLFEYLKNGYNVKQSSSGDGLPITRIETIAKSTINFERVGYAGLTENECSNFILKDGDILFSHINSISHLGKCAIYEAGMNRLVHGMNLLCFRPDQSKVLPYYALFLIRSSEFKMQMAKSIKKAVNQASVSAGDLRKITLNVAPLEEQAKFCNLYKEINARRQKILLSSIKVNELIESIQHHSFAVN